MRRPVGRALRGKTKSKRRLRLDFQVTFFRVSINKAILTKIFEGFYIETAHVLQARFGAAAMDSEAAKRGRLGQRTRKDKGQISIIFTKLSEDGKIKRDNRKEPWEYVQQTPEY